MKTWTWSQAWSRTKALWPARPGWLGWPAVRALGRAGLAVLAFVTPLRKWFVDILVVAIAVVFVVSAFLELWNTAPVMDPISVPKSLAERGYSGDVIAARLVDQARRIERDTNASSDRSGAAAAGGTSSLTTITVPGSGISLAVVVATVRRLLGRPERHIGGEIVVDDADGLTRYRMTIRIDGPDATAVEGQPERSVDAAIKDGARVLTGLLRPCAFAAVLLDEPGQNAADHFIAACLADASERDRDWAHNLKGLRLYREGRYDEAIAQYQEAIKRMPTYRSAFANWARTLCMKGDVTASIEVYRKAQSIGVSLRSGTDDELKARCEEFRSRNAPK